MVCGIEEEDFLEKFHNGTEYQAYEFFGCHKYSESEYIFRVWAPHAESVYVTGPDIGTTEMLRLNDGESFVAVVKANEGDLYCYQIVTFDGRRLQKADPYAFSSDIPNSFFSKICSLPLTAHNEPEIYDGEQPINIYEVSLLSWKRHKDKSYYTFAELEKELVPYVSRMGYTHVEFMPVTEFPFDGSWGYQVTGYFSVVSRLGTPQEFKRLIDAFHAQNIKVIIDWVPAHFPKDGWGLYEFDGQPLYESPLWDRMEHSGWGTRKFDFGRNEIDNFLLSSAVFFLDVYGVDGLRVDAVASMLYLDYDMNGQYTPNIYGDNRNLEAIQFIKNLNATIKSNFPSVIVTAEESTTYPGVTKPIADGGLGFDYKWNLGWMNDVLFYCRQDPYFRNHHHNKITFSMMYAFSERYILPLSHDEVVHVKGSIVNKMPGEYADKFAGERALLGLMYAHPGKKLNFMGYEIAQFKEWDYCDGIEFFLKKFEKHRKMTVFVKALNLFYRENRPLYEIEDSWTGFEWLVVDDRASNLFAFRRRDLSGNEIVAVLNFSGIDLLGYGIGIEEGTYRIVFNTDWKAFGGNGRFRKRNYHTVKKSSQGKENSIFIDVPKLSCIYLKKL